MYAEIVDRWMWSEACAMLVRAERLHRHLFQPQARSERPSWEPPADVLESEDYVLVLVALPGVDTERVEVAVEGDELVLAGARDFLPEMRTAIIHRLELPQGRFARRLQIPPGLYTTVSRSSFNGCLLIVLEKAEFGNG